MVDTEEAAYRSLQFKASAQRLFKTLSQRGRHMTKHQIETLIAKWLEEALDEAEDNRAISGPRSDADREAMYGGLSAAFDGAYEALLSNDYRSITTEADELLQAAGLPILDRTGADFARLCHRLLRAKIEYLRIEADRLDGVYREDHSQQEGASGVPKATKRKGQEEITSPPFSVVIEKYFRANPRPAKTEGQALAEFKRFLQVIGGDRPIHRITKADCVAYKETLQVTRKLSPATCLRHLLMTAAVFRWAIVHGYTKDNPAVGLAPTKRQARKAAMKRRPFTDEELLTVFSSEEFLAQRTERPERFWIVLILLFQICRREEAGQLYVKDIGEKDGIPFINITDEEADQTLKNEGSKRRVPIHPALLRLGFLGYVKAIRKAGHPRLFPQLDHKGPNGYADPVGKWFSRLVTSVGITDSRVVIHSLRHGGITKLHSAGVPGNLVETLVGHSAGNVHEDYVHRELISLKTLRDGLEKLQYSEVVEVLMGRG